MKSVLLTGATGFIGNHVLPELLKRYQVIATSSSPERAKTMEWFSKVSYIPFDLTTPVSEDLFRLFGKPDKLIHLAWEGLPNYKSEFHINDNLHRHYAFIENLVGNGLKDVTITGTCFEYGMQEGCLSENMPSLPANPYAIAKNELRMRLEKLSDTKPFALKWIRLFYMYGKGQSPKSLLSQLQSALDKGDPAFNMSPGDQLRDYLPVEKVAENIVRIAGKDKVTGIVNCCSGIPLPVKDLVTDFLKQQHRTIRLNLGYYPYSDLEPRNFWGDTTKLKTILGNE